MDVKYYIMRWKNGRQQFECDLKSEESVMESRSRVVHKKFLLPPSIDTLESLIDIARDGNEYSNIDMEQLRGILPYLEELNNLVGIESLKKTILNQVL